MSGSGPHVKFKKIPLFKSALNFRLPGFLWPSRNWPNNTFIFFGFKCSWIHAGLHFSSHIVLLVLNMCSGFCVVPVDCSVLSSRLFLWVLTFWHRSFTFNSNKSPTRCNNFSVYYPDVCLQLNMFWAFSHPSSGAQWLQWQLLVLRSYRGNSRAVFVAGPAGRPDHENSTTVTTIRR